jgi:hypothetical protein
MSSGVDATTQFSTSGSLVWSRTSKRPFSILKQAPIQSRIVVLVFLKRDTRDRATRKSATRNHAWRLGFAGDARAV